MTYATDDAERSSACEILYACRGKIASDIQQEASRDHPDARRLAEPPQICRDELLMWKIGARAMVLGVVIFISGCPNNGLDHAKLAAAREFYDQPVNERLRTFRQHSLEDQLNLFFFGNQYRHPPALYLAPCFALNGPPAVRLLRSKLGTQPDDLSLRDIAALLGTIDMMGQYDVAGDWQLVALLNSRIARMNDQNWRQSAEKEVSSYGKRRTEAAKHAPECA